MRFVGNPSRGFSASGKGAPRSTGYQLTRALPKDLASSLPSIEDIEAEMMGSMKAES